MKRFGLARFSIVLVSLVLTFIVAEIVFRIVLFIDLPTFNKLRNPALYADYFCDDDYWKLYYVFDGQYKPPKNPHPLLGWIYDFSRTTYLHNKAEYLDIKRPVLLYGDSFAACVKGVECFQDILNSDDEFSKEHYLLNYGVGGYGVGQIFLLMQNSFRLYEDPFVIISIMTGDLDRSILSVRTGQKPYFELNGDNLRLSGVPIETDSERFFTENPPRIKSYLWRFCYTNYQLPKKIASYLGLKTDRIKLKKELNSKIMLKLVEVLQVEDIDFFFLILHPHTPGISTLDNENSWRDRFLRQFLEEHNLPYIWSKEILRGDVEENNLQHEVRATDEVFDFLTHLNSAEIITQKADYIKVQQTESTINNDKRKILFEHPDSQVIFKNILINKNALLSFGISINDRAWGKEGDGVLFEISIVNEKLQDNLIYSRYIDPKNNIEDRKWHNEQIDLRAFAGQKATFIFKTSSGPDKNINYDWAGWAQPQILWQSEFQKHHTNWRFDDYIDPRNGHPTSHYNRLIAKEIKRHVLEK